VLGKILGKLLLKRLLSIFHKKNLFSEFQFGFCPKYTFHQLNRVVGLIATSLETKKYLSCAILFLHIALFLYILFTADIPSSKNTLMGTYADDTAILASDNDPLICSHLLQNYLNMLSTHGKLK